MFSGFFFLDRIRNFSIMKCMRNFIETVSIVSLILFAVNGGSDEWKQTDWSGGSGAQLFVDSTRYYIGNNVDGESNKGYLICDDATVLWQDGEPLWMRIDRYGNLQIEIEGIEIKQRARSFSTDVTEKVVSDSSIIYRFKIGEPIPSISQFSVIYKSDRKTDLYILNLAKKSQWEFVKSDTSISAVYNEGLFNYIDISGILNLKVQPGDVHTDLIEIEIITGRATIISKKIAPTPRAHWERFSATDSSVPNITGVVYSILDATSDSVLIDSIIDGQDISSLHTDSIRLMAILTTNDIAFTPRIYNWGVTWSYYKTVGSLISSNYGVSGDSVGNWGLIFWYAYTPTGTSITVETRTGDTPDNSAWSVWRVCTSDDSISGPSDKKYIQYKVTLFSTSDSTPYLEDITVEYSPSVPGGKSSDVDTVSFNFTISPTPTCGRTNVQYFISDCDKKSSLSVSLKIYNVEGMLVKNLLETVENPGEHTVTWDGKDESGRDVPSGLYFCRLKIEELSKTAKILILR